MLIGRRRSSSYLSFPLAAVTAMLGALVSGQHYSYLIPTSPGASQVVLVVKNHPATSGDIRDVGLIPGLGRFPGMATHFSIFAWKIPWTEEPSGLQSMGSPTVSPWLKDLACTKFEYLDPYSNRRVLGRIWSILPACVTSTPVSMAPQKIPSVTNILLIILPNLYKPIILLLVTIFFGLLIL